MRYTALLASTSPRRGAILRELNIPFETLHTEVDEVILPTGEATVRDNACIKAMAALGRLDTRHVVIAADTVLMSDGRVLGKPSCDAEARRFMTLLSGRHMCVCSAVAVVVGDRGGAEGWLGMETAGITLRALSEAEIAWYVSLPGVLSRAGALGIDAFGELFVAALEGSYSCCAGLPKKTLLQALARLPGAEGILSAAPPVDADVLLERLNFPPQRPTKRGENRE